MGRESNFVCVFLSPWIREREEEEAGKKDVLGVIKREFKKGLTVSAIQQNSVTVIKK